MTNKTTVLVTGASGTLGAAVLSRLAGEDVAVRPMSRRARTGWVAADLATGEGLAEAVRGVDAVVHLASGAGRDSGDIDVGGTGRLVAAARAADVRHLLYVSIVGVDRVPISYYRAKLAAERIVTAGEVPWTIVRATQFPQLVDRMLTASSRLGVLVVDRRVLVQPVHPTDVAERIASLLGAGPAGAVEFGGPEVHTFGELAAAWRQARAVRRPVLPIRVPGRAGRELRAGALTTAARPAGTRTWGDYLAGSNN
ncbi:nucleoside-diphosphate-sugar epimerase [Krasilnikovia cinnamomea]|uniref:Nucleoside-diphosphate-sugar epimerase n=1 Tax=Krasilnikovia cinnamomea TaxID=349313 RepID=A0A4Q7ZJD4_9ACTN|nr:NAD(P)H-binding protein [Krasilnikovia cinnamomea]RZU50990.1 nucleoside-diphosphate-sugar epimerase [Krasilnikovia cinnamomea]